MLDHTPGPRKVLKAEGPGQYLIMARETNGRLAAVITNRQLVATLRAEAAAITQAIQQLGNKTETELVVRWPATAVSDTHVGLINMLESLADYFEQAPNAKYTQRIGKVNLVGRCNRGYVQAVNHL